MEDDVLNISYSPIRNYNYSVWFENVTPNGKTLSDEERKEFVRITNETVSQYSSGLSIIQESIDSSRNLNDEFHKIEYIVSSVLLFTYLTSIDCLIAGKYFILADADYDKRFMRGKMIVILNEGFKRLYGFDSKKRKDSEWKRIEAVIQHFPEVIKRDYEELTQRLNEHSKASSWWREERNLEIHLEAEKLYKSRMEVIDESKVMMDSMKLFNTLLAVNYFLKNVHACMVNFLVDKYYRGELMAEKKRV